MKNLNRQQVLKRRGKAFLRHPLTVVVITALLSPIVIPALLHKSEIRQQRLKKALDLLDHDMEVNSHLNNLLTTLEIFHKDNTGVAARLVDYRQEQRELRKTMSSRYLEFDRIAWWWYKRVPTEAHLLGLISDEETTHIDSLVRDYETHLIETTNLINDLWNLFLRDQYDPTDKHNTEFMNETRKKFDELYNMRTRSLNALVELLASR